MANLTCPLYTIADVARAGDLPESSLLLTSVHHGKVVLLFTTVNAAESFARLLPTKRRLETVAISNLESVDFVLAGAGRRGCVTCAINMRFDDPGEPANVAAEYVAISEMRAGFTFQWAMASRS